MQPAPAHYTVYGIPKMTKISRENILSKQRPGSAGVANSRKETFDVFLAMQRVLITLLPSDERLQQPVNIAGDYRRKFRPRDSSPCLWELKTATHANGEKRCENI